jgi:hypothetical protein
MMILGCRRQLATSVGSLSKPALEPSSLSLAERFEILKIGRLLNQVQRPLNGCDG